MHGKSRRWNIVLTEELMDFGSNISFQYLQEFLRIVSWKNRDYVSDLRLGTDERRFERLAPCLLKLGFLSGLLVPLRQERPRQPHYPVR